MADWYVDNSIAGNGTAPNTAFPSVSSVVWGNGDRAWVRKTHVESFPDSAFVGIKSGDNKDPRRCFIIGWPSSGDPWYDERPTAGISAWDSDHAGTDCYSVHGLDFPTFSASHASAGFGPQINGGSYMFNLCLSNVASSNTFWWWRVNSNAFIDNCAMLRGYGCYQTIVGNDLNFFVVRFGKFYMATSGAATGFSDNAHIRAEHLVLLPATVVNCGFVIAQSSFIVEHITNQSNSVDYLFRELAHDNTNFDRHAMVRRVDGIKPYSGAVIQGVTGERVNQYCWVDDWYGEGPIMGNPLGGVEVRMASSAEAMFNGNRAMAWETKSFDNTNEHYNDAPNHQKIVRAFFDVTSGTQSTFRAPFYVDSTGVHSPTNGLWSMRLMSKNANPVYNVRSRILPGTPALWTGSLISGGSAYFFEGLWTPIETANVELQVSMPTLAKSGAGAKISYFLVGAPYKV